MKNIFQQLKNNHSFCIYIDALKQQHIDDVNLS